MEGGKVVAMYESPITVYIDNAINDFGRTLDAEIEKTVHRAVMRVGISVDKEKLLRALAHDSDQYLKGYRDGEEAAQPKWISVEERLPPCGERVLASAGGRVVYEAYIDCNERWKRANSDHGFLFKITHWMHLPKPPKEENHA